MEKTAASRLGQGKRFRIFTWVDFVGRKNDPLWSKDWVNMLLDIDFLWSSTTTKVFSPIELNELMINDCDVTWDGLQLKNLLQHRLERIGWSANWDELTKEFGMSPEEMVEQIIYRSNNSPSGLMKAGNRILAKVE